MELNELYDYLVKCEGEQDGFKYKPEQPFCDGTSWQMEKVQSNASCKVQDIQNIVFGPAQSRFWLYRKHMNSISLLKYKKSEVPFYAW